MAQLYYAWKTPYYTEEQPGTYKFQYTRKNVRKDKFNIVTVWLLYRDSGQSILDYWNRLAADSGSGWEYVEHKE